MNGAMNDWHGCCKCFYNTTTLLAKDLGIVLLEMYVSFHLLKSQLKIRAFCR